MTSTGASTDKVASVEDAVKTYVKTGMTVLVGGFGRGGTPFTLLEYLADHSDAYRELTLVKNDASEPRLGLGPLFRAGMVRSLVSTHIGLNPEVIAMMNAGEIAVTLIPQGIFAEKIRAKGAGIPAFLTDIGMGTPIAEGRDTVVFEGRPYLLEAALGGDVSLLSADKADRMGNCWWRGSNRNMNVVMGMASPKVVVEAKDIVEVGELAPEAIHLPGICVDAVVRAEKRRHQTGEGA